MAFKTNQLASTYRQITNYAGVVKSQTQSLRNASAAGNIHAMQIIDWFVSIGGLRTQLSNLSSAPGLAGYAKTECADVNYDVAAEFTAMLAAIDTSLAWVTTNFPKDGNGFILSHTFVAGVYTARTFTTGETATLRTVLDALIATIS